MYLGVDVGGTKTMVACFDNNGKIVSELKFDTPKDYHYWPKMLTESLELLEFNGLKSGTVAIPGVVDRDNGVGIEFGNLPWQNVLIKTDVQKITGCPILIENDAKAGGLAEAKLIINDFKHVLYVALGTGIGISVIENGVIDLTTPDLGGHVLTVTHEGKTAPWEDFASGKAIVERYGKKAYEITNPETWKKIVQDFAAGIIPLVDRYDSDSIVIGGGVGSHFDRFGNFLKERLVSAGVTAPVFPAKYPEESVIYGCYELASQG